MRRGIIASVLGGTITSTLWAQPLDQVQLHTPIVCDSNAHVGHWINTGPFETSPGGPHLGQIHAIAVHPRDTLIIYAGAPNGGMWKTTDGGKHWKSLINYETLPPIGVRSIAINPHDPNIILAATTAGQGRWASNPSTYYGVGVIVSLDGGETWEQTKLRFDPTGPFEWYGQIETFKVIILPRSAAESTWALAMTKNQVYLLSIIPSNRSAEVSIELQGGVYNAGTHRDLEVHPANPDVIWLATTTGLLRSRDGGASWDTLRTYHLPEPKYSYLHACPFGQTNTKAMYIEYKLGRLFLLHEVVDANCENKKVTIQYSTDLGNTWQGYFVYDNERRPNMATFNIFAVSETDSSIYVRDPGNYVGKRRLDLTSRPMSTANTHVDARGFLVFNFNGAEILYQGNDGGINISTDHRSWRDITGSGLAMGQHYGIGNDPNDVNRYIAGAQDGSVNSFENGRWLRVSGGDNGDAIFHPDDTNIVFFSSNNSVMRSTNGGTTFSTLKVGDGGMAAVVFPMALHPHYPDTMFVGFKKLWRSDDASHGKGTSFYEVHAPHGSRYGVSSIEISRAAPRIVYYSYNYYHYNGGDSTVAVLFRSVDGGVNPASWKNITGMLGRNISHNEAPLMRGPINDIVTDPNDAARVWVCFGGFGDGKKVYYSNDTGNTWQNMSTGLPNLPATCLAYHAPLRLSSAPPGRLYLGMDGGVYYWEQDSSRWYRYCGGFPNAIVLDMDIHACGNLLRVATFGRGIWETGLIPLEPRELRGLTIWSGWFNMTQDIRVRKRATLIVKGTVNMAQGTKIILDKKAKLIVDGGKITNLCGAEWEFEKWVHPKAKLELKNGGVIENDQ